MSRDPRIDVLRAVCVLSMTTGHLLGGTWFDVATHPFVFVDGAAGFVACSAVVLGMVQRHLRERDGSVIAHRALLRRVAVIYGAHIALVVAAVLARSTLGRPEFVPTIDELGGAGDALAAILTLRVQPPFLNVLPLYVFFLVVAHGVVFLAARRLAVLAAVASIAVYWWSRNGGDFHGPDLLSEAPAVFSWGQWQVLFVLGMIVGWYWPAVRRVASSWAGPPLVGLAIVATVALATWSQAWRLGKASFYLVIFWLEKYSFQPGMLVYTAAVAITGYWLVGLLFRPGPGRVVRVLETIGVRPLFCFLTLLIVELVTRSIVAEVSPGLGAILTVVVLGIGWAGGAAKQRAQREREAAAPAELAEAEERAAENELAEV